MYSSSRQFRFATPTEIAVAFIQPELVRAARIRWQALDVKVTDIRFLLPLSLSRPVLLAHFYFAFLFWLNLLFLCCFFLQCGIYNNGTESGASHCVHLWLIDNVLCVCKQLTSWVLSFVFCSRWKWFRFVWQNRPTASKLTLRLTERQLPQRFVHERMNGNVKSNQTMSSNHGKAIVPWWGHLSTAISFIESDMTTQRFSQSAK